MAVAGQNRPHIVAGTLRPDGGYHGAEVPPLLFHGAAVDRMRIRGTKEEKVEDWRREERPTWHRWAQAETELKKRRTVDPSL